MNTSTIIIPTYNRHAFLRRILSYYDSFGEDFRVLVADSSSDETKKLNCELLSRFSNLRILYLDKYPSDLYPYYKYDDALKYCDTEYCVFCADDDFVTINGIKRSLSFLDSNPDFVVAYGRYIGFKLIDQRQNKRSFHWDFTGDLPLSIELSTSERRLEGHLARYFTSTLYGVHRTSILKKVYYELLRANIDLVVFGELLSSMLTLIYGKIKYLDILYGLRSDQTMNIDSPTLRTAIEAGTFPAKYAPFRACLAENLSRASSLSIEESGKLVDRAFSVYLQGRSLTPVIPVPKSKKRTALESLHLPQWAQDGIISSYAFTHKLAAVKAQSLYNTVLGKPMFEFKNRYDFRRIRRLVTAQA